MRCEVPRFAEGAVSYQPEVGSMHVLRILLLVMTAGVLAFILYRNYPANTKRRFLDCDCRCLRL
jgi:hypothetical protein